MNDEMPRFKSLPINVNWTSYIFLCGGNRFEFVNQTNDESLKVHKHVWRITATQCAHELYKTDINCHVTFIQTHMLLLPSLGDENGSKMDMYELFVTIAFLTSKNVKFGVKHSKN